MQSYIWPWILVEIALRESKWILALGCKLLTLVVPTVLSGASVFFFLGGGG